MNTIIRLIYPSGSESDFSIPELDDAENRIFTYSGPPLGPHSTTKRRQRTQLTPEFRRRYIRLRKPLAILEHLAALPESKIPDEETFVRLYNLFNDGIVKYKLKNPVPPELDDETRKARKNYIDTCNFMCGIVTGFDPRHASLAKDITELTLSDGEINAHSAVEYLDYFDCELSDYYHAHLTYYQSPLSEEELSYRFLLSIREGWEGFLFKYFRYFRDGAELPDRDDIGEELVEWARKKNEENRRREFEEGDIDEGDIQRVFIGGFTQQLHPNIESFTRQLNGLDIENSDTNEGTSESISGTRGNRGGGNRGRGNRGRGNRGRGNRSQRGRGGNPLQSGGHTTPPPRVNNAPPVKADSMELMSPD